MPRIRITAARAGVSMTAALNDSHTAAELLKVLPAESQARIWGDEVYLEIPLDLPEEDAQADVPSGTIAYWPPGTAFCIFFGQTPYSPVNVLGKVDGDETAFSAVQSGDTIRLERVSPMAGDSRSCG